MNILNLIEKKKNCKKISKDEFDFFIKGILNKTIKDYQISSFLMAIFLNKLDFNETFYLTKAIVENGMVIDYSQINSKIIDKHSTGGIGDKVSLILIPLLASLDIKVAKMAGRGLGYTGGTIDKLESINIDTNISQKKCISLLEKFNMFIISQNKEIAPADKILYSIRDTSGTTNNISLIASSILSKKLATNTDNIYLDVKVGDGGFFSNIKEAKEFSNLCIKICKKYKKKLLIHLTNMDKPLGKCLGNMIEIKESLNFLKGNFLSKELKDLIFNFAIDILIDMKKVKNKIEGLSLIEDSISSLKAYNLFCEWSKSQNCNLDLSKIDEIYNPQFKEEIFAEEDGYLDFYSNKNFGYCLVDIKAGRLNKEDKIDYLSGIYLNKTYNEEIKKGDLLIVVYSNYPILIDVINKLKNNIKYLKTKGPSKKIILEVIK